MATNAEWAGGYARQAGADFETYIQLHGKSSIPQCHKLQFLQMACEKLVKAHLIKGGTDPQTLQTSHTRVEGTLPVGIRQQLSSSDLGTHNPAWIMELERFLAEEIEILAPAVKRGGTRPDNCDYPMAFSMAAAPTGWK